MIKSFQTDFIDKIKNIENENDKIIISISFNQQNSSKNRNSAVDKNNQSANSSSVSSFQNPSSADRFIRNRRLSVKYQNFVDIIVLLQNEAVSLSFVES